MTITVTLPDTTACIGLFTNVKIPGTETIQTSNGLFGVEGLREINVRVVEKGRPDLKTIEAVYE